MNSRLSAALFTSIFSSLICEGTVQQFSFVPSPNITILQSAVYQCTVNEGVPISWTVNGTFSGTGGDTSDWLSLTNSTGIKVDGVGVHDRILTIPGNNLALNGTTVECSAAGLNNANELVYETDNATLYIQGKPFKVGVSCQYEPPYTINCTWNTPFILPGINGSLIYRVNISVDSSDHLMMNTTSDNEYSINVAPGIYTVSVVAVIGSGDEELEGDIDTTLVDVTEVHFESNISLHHNDKNQLFCNVSVMGLEYRPHSTVLYTNSSNYTIDQLNDNGGLQGWTGIADVTDMSRMRNVMAYVVVYYNGIPFNSTNVHTISTFDVIGLSINPTNQTTPYNDTAVRVCFTCVFNPLVSKPIGCNVTYISTSEQLSGSVYVGVTNCSDIIVTTYNITVYDVNEKNVSYESKPALKMDNVQIYKPNSASPVHFPPFSKLPLSTSDTTSSTVSTIAASSSPNGKGGDNTAAIVIGVICAIILLLVIMVIVLTALIVHKNKHPVPKGFIDENSSELPIKDGNYTQPDFLPEGTRSRVPPNSSNAHFPYSTVEQPPPLTTSNNDEYSKIQREQRHTAAANGHHQLEPSPLYSTLNNEAPKTDEGHSTSPGQVPGKADNSQSLTYKYVVDNIVNRIPHDEWYRFGQALPLTPTKLEEIRENHPDNERGAFCDVIQEWKSSEIRPFTMNTLKMVLNKINRSDLITDESKC